MSVETVVIIYVLGLLLTVLVSLLKNKIFTAVPIIISSIIFIATKEENFYMLAFYQVIVCFVSIIVQYIVNAIVKKARNSEVDKSKIKDLM